MKHLITIIFLFSILCFGFKIEKKKTTKKPVVLIFSLTKGYHHASIADGIVAIKKLGAENRFAVDTTTDVRLFTPENLKKYKTLDNSSVFFATNFTN